MTNEYKGKELTDKELEQAQGAERRPRIPVKGSFTKPASDKPGGDKKQILDGGTAVEE